MSGLAFEHVSKVFPDGTAAVADLDLRIADGEFCVLLGPSGCGKSTVLRLVAGLEEVTRGTIRIGDRAVDDVPPRERDLAMVFETSALYPHLTVAENMGFSLKLRGEPPAARHEDVGRAASRLGIRALLGRRPRQLSQGERQQVALGRATVRRPAAFLMDEPLANLDAQRRVAMRSSLARLRRELGATVLYVTHDQTEAMSLGDRVAVMRDGRVEQVGEPLALYERPATLFVASFVGSPPMNLWHVRLAGRDGRVVVVCGEQRLVMPDAVVAERRGLRSRVGGHLVLGLRPEALVPADALPGAPVLELPVTEVDALGSHQLVHLEAPGAGLQLAGAGDARSAGVHEEPDRGGTATFVRPTATLTARLPAQARVLPGQRLRLGVDFRKAHFFDPSTQYALR